MLFSTRTMRTFGLVVATVAFAACRPDTPQASVPDDISVDQLPIVMADPLAGTYNDQAISHDDATVGTFKQRYWYSTEFVSGPNAPVIFYFCGEAACSPKYVQSMSDMAKSMGAAVIALEHRYYGQSLPFTPLTIDNMKYLTIHNALA